MRGKVNYVLALLYQSTYNVVTIGLSHILRVIVF